MSSCRQEPGGGRYGLPSVLQLFVVVHIEGQARPSFLGDRSVLMIHADASTTFGSLLEMIKD